MNSINPDGRIVIISPTESELTMRGKRHPNLAKYLSIHGWNVEYISSDFNHAEKRQFSDDECKATSQKLPYALNLLDVGKYKRNLSIRRILWNIHFSLCCYRRLKKLLNEKDTIVIPSRPPELIYAAMRLKRELGCRIVLDIRDVWPDALVVSSGFIRRGFGAYCNFFLCHSVDQFDAYLHVAPSFLSWLHRYASDAKSIFIPLGFDEKRWGSEPPVRKSVQGDILRLVYCGTLTNQFNIMPVLQAMVKQSGRFHLTLIGDNGTGERYLDVKDFIQNQNLNSEVTLLGLLPPDELVKELQLHDITIIPMVSGALPNKVFDSIAAGLPMISLGTGDSSTLIEKYDLGWTASFSARSVSEVLSTLSDESVIQKTKNVLEQRSKYMQGNLFAEYEFVLCHSK